MIQNKSNIELSNWELVSVNPNKKDWNWKDLFCFWANNIQTIIGFSLIASFYLLYDLNIIIVFFRKRQKTVNKLSYTHNLLKKVIFI